MPRVPAAPSRRVGLRELLALAALSSAILAYEVTLTRVIAVRHWHHLVPVVIALALLGFGSAGAWVALRAGRRGPGEALSRWSGAFALSIPAAIRAANDIPLDLPALAWQPEEAWHLLLYAAALFVPFFLGAVGVASLFARAPSEAGRIYAANLLGSAAGSLGALGLLAGPGIPGTLALAAGGGGLAAVLFSRRLRLAAVTGVLLGAAIGLGAKAGMFGVDPDPSKPLPTVLLARGVRVIEERESAGSRLTLVTGEALHAMPGLSIRSTAALPPQDHLFVDGDDAGPLFDSALAPGHRRAFTEVLAALPFVLRPGASVVVCGPGEAFVTWVAEANGAGRIAVLEPDPAMAGLLAGSGGANGSPRFLPASANVIRRGLRIWARGDAETTDLIRLGIGSSSVGSASETITYEATREGFAALLEKLAPRGILAVEAPIEPVPHAALRLAATAAGVLERRGSSPAEHVVAVRDWNQVLFLVARNPWEEADLEKVRRFAEIHAFDLCLAPGLSPGERNRFHRLPPGGLDEGLARVTGEGRGRFLADSVFDATPATDDRPFFHHRVKLGRWRELAQSAGRDWPRLAGWGYLLSWISLGVVVLAGCIVSVLPFAVGRRRPGAFESEENPRVKPGAALSLAYFSLIGLGFMGMEIAFLGKSRLLFDAVTPTFAFVITAVLVGAGFGSWCSGRRGTGFFHSGGVVALAGGAGGLAFLGLDAMPSVAAGTLAARGAAAVLLLGAGFLLGVPFPSGLARGSGAGSSRAAWAFAMNGVASVAGSLLAALLALHAGYRILALVSLAAYLLAALVFRRIPRLIPGRSPA